MIHTFSASIYGEVVVFYICEMDESQGVITPPCGAFDLGLAVSVPLPIVMGIFVLLWFQSCLT